MKANQHLEWFSSIPVERADALKLEFASSIDKAINTLGLSRKDVAAKVGATSAWITKVLRGDANLTIDSMAKLAEAVGYSLHFELIYTSETPAILSDDTFTFDVFKKAKFKGAKEADFRYSPDFNIVTNESEYADAA